MAKFSVIIPAAGRSTRYGGSRNKLLEVLHGRPVIHWAVAAFLRRRDVASVVLPTQEQRTIAKAIGIETTACTTAMAATAGPPACGRACSI